jgi:hypothetical protein
MKTTSNPSLALAALALALALAGCGGGGGDAAPANLQLSQMQGFWSGPLTGATLQTAASTQAVLLPDGQAWLLLLNSSNAATGLVKATLTVAGPNYTGTGKVYDFSNAGATALTLSGSASASGGVESVLTVGGASTTTRTSLAHTGNDITAYNTAVTLANVNASWQVSASGGALLVDWTVAGDGTLTGTSNTGCTWAGAFSTRSGGTAVLNYTATETCASVTTTYSGIAVLNGARTAGRLFLTTASDAQGLALSMTKQVL